MNYEIIYTGLPEFFAERFELNDDYFKQASCFI